MGPAESDRERRVVLLAPTARDASMTKALLEGEGFPVTTVTDVGALCRAISEGAGLAVFPDDIVTRSGAGALAAVLREQPAWSDLPLLVLTRGGSPLHEEPSPVLGLGNVTLLERPVRVPALLSLLRSAWRARQRQYEIRAHLLEVERTQAALRTSEARLRAAMTASRSGTFGWDLRDGALVMDENLRELLGMENGHAHDIGELLGAAHPEHRDRLASALRRCRADGADLDLDFRTATPEPDGRWFTVRGQLVRDGQDRPAYLTGACVEITERRRLEEEVLRVSRLESVALLAGGIAHDFNNILTAIIGNVALAARSAAKGLPGVEERLQAAEAAAVRAQGLTQQLLTFARGGAPVKAALDLRDLVRESAGFALQGSNVVARFDLAEDLPPVSADAGQLHQVVHNLVLNAVQAMPEGGAVTIRAVGQTLQESGAVPLPSGDYVAVSVADEGVGIAPGDLGRVFDLFFTTRAGGSGLGLATSHSIIQRHGGHLTVQSKVGHGSTFTFLLPVSREEPAAERPRERSDLGGRGRILVMDDEPAVREVAWHSLLELGYEPSVARDGREAIDLYREAWACGEPFHAVILDVTVPGGMGGREAIERLLAMDPGVRAIVASGYSNDRVLADHEAYGFLAAMPKPYSIRELGRVLRSVLAGVTISGPLAARAQ